MATSIEFTNGTERDKILFENKTDAEGLQIVDWFLASYGDVPPVDRDTPTKIHNWKMKMVTKHLKEFMKERASTSRMQLKLQAAQQEIGQEAMQEMNF